MTVSTRLPARRLLCMTVSTRLPARRLLCMTVSTRLPARRLLCMTVSTRLPARRLLRMACFILTRQQARRLFRIDPATSPAAALYRPCYRLCACFVSIRLPTRRLLCIDPATGPAPALYLPCYRDRPDTCSVIIIESVWPALYRPGNRPGTCSVSTRLPAGSGPATAPYSDPCI
jgi:hypothetical protein